MAIGPRSLVAYKIGTRAEKSCVPFLFSSDYPAAFGRIFIHEYFSELVSIAWPISAGAGLLLLLFSNSVRKTEPDLIQAYVWMRASALAFGLALFLLWLRWML